jgi:AbrB family looped-hinge helix DNA binding protein
MQTRVSSKGQIVLPLPIRNGLGIRTGDPLDARIEGDHVILSPVKPKRRKGRIVIDPRTGLPAVTFGKGAPKVTSAMVEKLLEEFP